MATTRQLLMIVPALLACGPGRGDGVARQQPVQVIVDDDPFLERGQSHPAVGLPLVLGQLAHGDLAHGTTVP